MTRKHKYSGTQRDLSGLGQFLIFECPQHYPGGGMDDCIASSDTLKEAREYCLSEAVEQSPYRRAPYNDIHILDRLEGKVYNLHD